MSKQVANKLHRAPTCRLAEKPDRLFQIDSVCIMPVGHRLASRKKLKPSDLEGEAFISLAKPDELRKTVDDIFDAARVKRRLNLETSYSSVICTLVSLGMGVSVVSPFAAQDYRKNALVTRPLFPAVKCDGLLIFPKGRPTSNLVGDFTQVLRKVAREECDALQRP